MKPPQTIVAHLVSLPGLLAPVHLCLCLDCHEAMSREERAAAVYTGDVHSWQVAPLWQCSRCDMQVNGPIHLDPGSASWGPKGDN